MVVVECIDTRRGRVVEGRPLGAEPIRQVLTASGVRIAPSACCAAGSGPSSARAVRDAELLTAITTVDSKDLGVHGAGKIHAALNRKPQDRAARCTVEWLMRAAGLRGIARKKDPQDHHRRRLRRDSPAPGPGAATLRCHPPQSRCGRPISPTPAPAPAGPTSRSCWMCSPRWSWAGRCRPARAPTWPWRPSTRGSRPGAATDLTGLVHHSDRGAHYRAIRDTERLAKTEAVAVAVASVGSKDDSHDNAMAEALNPPFKAERIRNPTITTDRRPEDCRRCQDHGRRAHRPVQPPPPPQRTRAGPTH